MLWRKTKLAPICAECKYLIVDPVKQPSPPTPDCYRWKCQAHIRKEAHRDPLTGKAVPARHDDCWFVNCEGQCLKFEPAENKET